MNNQQIKEWIDDLEDAALGYVSGYPDPLRLNAAAASIGLRELLKTHAIVPRVPSDGLLVSMAMRNNHGFGLLSESAKASALIPMRQIHEEVVGIGFYRHDRDPKYKAMIEASENNPELSQSESKEE